jgi:hypothetical protein
MNNKRFDKFTVFRVIYSYLGEVFILKKVFDAIVFKWYEPKPMR